MLGFDRSPVFGSLDNFIAMNSSGVQFGSIQYFTLVWCRSLNLSRPKFLNASVVMPYEPAGLFLYAIFLNLFPFLVGVILSCLLLGWPSSKLCVVLHVEKLARFCC